MPDPLLYLKLMGGVAIVSGAVVLIIAGFRRPAGPTRLNLACVLAIGLGLAASCLLLPLRLAWPPVNGLDRLATVVVPAALGIELIAGFQRVLRWVAWSLRTCLAVATPRILLHGSVYLSGLGNDWNGWRTGTALLLCGALLAGIWGLLAWLQQRSPGVSIPLALCLTTSIAGLTIMMAGYLKGGAAAFTFTATIAAATIGARLIVQRAGTPAIVGIGVVGMFGLLLIGRFFGRLSTGCALAMLLAPLLCWVTEAPLLRRQKPWIVGSTRLALVAIPLLAALAVAKRTFDQDMAPLLSKAQTTANPPAGNR
jgi:hypothetical protein